MNDMSLFVDSAIILFAFGSLFFILIVPIIIMCIFLVKKDDERGKMIIEKTCAETFIALVLMHIINILGGIFTDFEVFENQSSEIALLAVISILFIVNLFGNKRKYGS